MRWDSKNLRVMIDVIPREPGNGDKLFLNTWALSIPNGITKNTDGKGGYVMLTISCDTKDNEDMKRIGKEYGAFLESNILERWDMDVKPHVPKTHRLSDFDASWWNTKIGIPRIAYPFYTETKPKPKDGKDAKDGKGAKNGKGGKPEKESKSERGRGGRGGGGGGGGGGGLDDVEDGDGNGGGGGGDESGEPAPEDGEDAAYAEAEKEDVEQAKGELKAEEEVTYYNLSASLAKPDNISDDPTSDLVFRPAKKDRFGNAETIPSKFKPSQWQRMVGKWGERDGKRTRPMGAGLLVANMTLQLNGGVIDCADKKGNQYKHKVTCMIMHGVRKAPSNFAKPSDINDD